MIIALVLIAIYAVATYHSLQANYTAAPSQSLLETHHTSAQAAPQALYVLVGFWAFSFLVYTLGKKAYIDNADSN